jgi:hypothetical protein
MQTSIETTATVEAIRHLVLDEDIPAPIARRVRVIVLIDEDVNESDWSKSAASNEAFDFLTDDSEDIYSPLDGSPLEHET